MELMKKVMTLAPATLLGAIWCSAVIATEAIPRVYGTHIQEGRDIRPVDSVGTTRSSLNRLDVNLQQEAEALSVPRRFHGYRPQFRVETRTFEFNHLDGPRSKEMYIIWDGPRFVALIQKAHDGFAQLVATDPHTAPRRIGLTTGRFHIDRHVGSLIDASMFCTRPTREGDVLSDQWEHADDQVIFHRRLQTEGRKVHNRLVFSVDPVFGYRADGTYRIALEGDPPESDIKVWSYFIAPGTYVPWREDARYRYGVLATKSGYTGWATNQHAIDRSDQGRDIQVGNPGLIAYLSCNPQAFSPAQLLRTDSGPRDFVQCNAGHGLYLDFKIPRDSRSFTCEKTLFHLPPEMRARILSQTDFVASEGTGVYIRVGRVEDFEDQPLPLTRDLRGLIWTSGAPAIDATVARTGRNSMRLERDSWPNLPQLNLEPETRYRLEAYVKVDEKSEAERLMELERLVERQLRADGNRHRKWKRKREKDPGFDGPEPVVRTEQEIRQAFAEQVPKGGAAWIEADFYEWSPHAGEMVTRHRTNVASAMPGWQLLSLEFTTPRWDPFLNLSFKVRGCKVWMDDFFLGPSVLPAPGKSSRDVDPKRSR